MSYLATFFDELWRVLLEAGPWLLVGLIVSGLIKAFMPVSLMTRWLGGRGVGPIMRAAILGTPLPLCSCSVVPAAVTLRRGGASRGATASFLVATPENGADSIALSYALLGPVMTLLRPVAAIFSALLAGLLTSWTQRDETAATPPASCSSQVAASCCGGDKAQPSDMRLGAKLVLGGRYAIGDLLGDIAPWLAVGLVLAAVINTFVSPGQIAGWGSGLPAMGLMLLIGVPMYICATASTPVAASMLIAGVSPGTVLVFLLAGPATNPGTLGIVRRELGGRAAGMYLTGVAVGAVVAGLVTDWMVADLSLDVAAQAADGPELIPHALSVASVVVLGLLTVRMVWLRTTRTARR